MAKAYQEGAAYSARVRRAGHDVYVSGFKTKRAAEDAAVQRFTELRDNGKPQGKGPGSTTLGEALQTYGLERLPYLKGASQEAQRINRFLRNAEMDTLVVRRLHAADESGAYFAVTLEPFLSERRIPRGLHEHRRKLLNKSADTNKLKGVLVTMYMSEVTRSHLQHYIDSLRQENLAPATIALERALLRALFNHARRIWNWHGLKGNPATHLKLPTIDNQRQRVLSREEQGRLDEALGDCRNGLVRPVYVLLRETGMRASEPLEKARWSDVDWSRKVLRLTDSKTGMRDVPLSPAAIEALRELEPGEPDEPLVRISYEALRAAWRRCCERAGIEGLHVHDLRHTAATRLALKSGNIFLVKLLTGHRTIKMLERYVNPTADDVVEYLHASEAPAPPPAQGTVASPVPATGQAVVQLTQEQLQQLIGQVVAAASGQGGQPEIAAPQSGVAGNVVPLRKVA